MNVAQHAMWADELKPWTLSLMSDNLAELYMNLNLEGHPPLWYLVLWPLTGVTSNVLAMKVITGLIGVGSMGLLWLYSPLSTLEKTLLSTSFQIGYTLTVVSRGYCLGVFLTFLFLLLSKRCGSRTWLCWSVLGLLANTHIYFTMVSFFLALLWIRLSKEQERSRLLDGMLFYLLSLAICSATIFQIFALEKNPAYLLIYAVPVLFCGAILALATQPFPEKRIGKSALILGSVCSLALLIKVFELMGAWLQSAGSKAALQALSTLGRGLVPLVNPTQPDFWNLSMPDVIGLTLFLVALVAIVGLFRHQPLALGLLLAQVGIMAALYTVVYSGQLWHTGVLFTAVIATLWMLRDRGLPLGSHWFLLMLLLPQAAVGCNAMIHSRFTPLTNNQRVANWIRANHLEDQSLIVHPPFPGTSLTACLARPLYFPVHQRSVYYSTWRDSVPRELFAKIIERHMRVENRETAYLILETRSEKAIVKTIRTKYPSIRCEELFRADNALRENYAVYRLTLTD